ncbi:hypothetical protein [Pantoea ananatis]|uniref:hypothetical protein n=1 Tax=Pantoea ananas TaxID=553 RepID=UPI0039B912F5
MALGSLLLAPLADRWGRRNMILCCLAILTVGMAVGTGAGSGNLRRCASPASASAACSPASA